MFFKFQLIKSFLLQIEREQEYKFSQIGALRIVFLTFPQNITTFPQNITYEYYLKQPKTICEQRLIQRKAKNPEMINSTNRHTFHPLIKQYANVYQ